MVQNLNFILCFIFVFFSIDFIWNCILELWSVLGFVRVAGSMCSNLMFALSVLELDIFLFADLVSIVFFYNFVVVS